MPWTETAALREGNRVKTPYPDFTYAFPIHDQTALRTARLLHGTLESDGVANFSLKFHQELRGKGIVTSPSRRLAGKEHTKHEPRKDHEICFPWAVVEVKRDEKDKVDLRTKEVRCYCQAANACAAALALQQPLRESIGWSGKGEMYPIIAFTCSGPIVKTWLAYETHDDERLSTVSMWPSTLPSTDSFDTTSLTIAVHGVHLEVRYRNRLGRLLPAFNHQEHAHICSETATAKVSQSSITATKGGRLRAAGISAAAVSRREQVRPRRGYEAPHRLRPSQTRRAQLLHQPCRLGVSVRGTHSTTTFATAS